MLTALWAVRVPQNRSRACTLRWNALCAVLLHHILQALQMLRICPFGLAKRHLPKYVMRQLQKKLYKG
jgi:hypothetical protein